MANSRIYFEKSLAIREELNQHYELVSSYWSIGELLCLEKKYKLGIEYIQKGINLAKEKGYKAKEEKLNKSLSNEYKKIGKYKEALEYEIRSRELRDSILNEKTTLQINDLEAKYENAQKENEILALSMKNKEKDVRNFLMSVGLVLVFFALGIVFYFYKKLQSKNTIITKALEEKNTLLKEIHHRVKNNLQVISSLLNLQSRYIDDNKALEAIQLGKSRVMSMALIHQRLYQKDNLVNINAKEYIEQLSHELFNTYKIKEENIHLNLNVDDINIDVDKMVPIGLIINELVTNSLKYAFVENQKGIITVVLKNDDENKLLLSVEDNGKGFDEDLINNNKSFGYRLIQSFSKKLNAELIIKNLDGFKISLIIPHNN